MEDNYYSYSQLSSSLRLDDSSSERSSNKFNDDCAESSTDADMKSNYDVNETKTQHSTSVMGTMHDICDLANVHVASKFNNMLIQQPISFDDNEYGEEDTMTPLHTNKTILSEYPEQSNRHCNKVLIVSSHGSPSKPFDSKRNITNQPEHNITATLKYNKDTDIHIAERWNRFTYTRRWYILLSVPFLCIFGGIYCLPRFIASTDSTFHPTPGSLSYQAIQVFRRAYSNGSTETLRENDPMNPGIVMVLQSVNEEYSLTDKSSPLYNFTKSFVLDMEEFLFQSLCQYVRRHFYNHEDDIDKILRQLEVHIISFYSLDENGLPTVAKKLVADSGSTTIASISYSIPARINKEYSMKRIYISSILDSIQTYAELYAPLGVNVSCTGLRYFDRDIATGVKKDLQRMDFLCFPLALVVLSIVLGGYIFVLIVPFLTLICSVSTWSIIMYPLAKVFCQITTVTPTVMMSLTVGLGIDYTLFLLSRVLSELNDHEHRSTKYDAIGIMIRYTCHTILASGVTLGGTFFAMIFMPLRAIQSIAIGSCIAIGSSILVNLILVPAMLHTDFLHYNMDKKQYIFSFTFLAKEVRSQIHHLGDQWRLWFNTWQQRINRELSSDSIVIHDFAEDEYLSFRDLFETRKSFIANESIVSREPLLSSGNSPDNVELSPGESFDSALSLEEPSIKNDIEPSSDCAFTLERIIKPLRSSFWCRLSMQLSRPLISVGVLVLMVIVLIPTAFNARLLRLSISMDLMLSDESPSFITMDKLGKKFGYGLLTPYRLIFDGEESNQRIDSESGFKLMHDFIDALKVNESSRESVSDPQAISYTGIAWYENTKISFPMLEISKACTALFSICPVEPLHILHEINARSSTQSGLTTFITCKLPYSGFSDEALSWLASTRQIIKEWHDEGRFLNFTVVLEGGAAVEYDALESVTASFPTVMIKTAFIVFVAVAFFFRSIIVPLRSIVSVSVTLICVFGFMVLVYQDGYLNWTSIHSLHGKGDVSWLAPILAFNVIIGLSLDYDLFLFSRVMELRMQGFTHTSSVAAGLHYTGKIVTAAGIIMTIAFGGLLLSTSPLLNQWSFLLSCAVLFDTFVVRLLVVPILLHILGDFSYWPRKLPSSNASVFSLSGDSILEAESEKY